MRAFLEAQAAAVALSSCVALFGVALFWSASALEQRIEPRREPRATTGETGSSKRSSALPGG